MQFHDSTSTAGDSRSTERARILDLLTSARGGWVPLPEIAALAAQYNARIFELRRVGFAIINRTAERDGVRVSWFRLVSNPPAIESARSPADGRDVSVNSETRSAGNATVRSARQLALF